MSERYPVMFFFVRCILFIFFLFIAVASNAQFTYVLDQSTIARDQSGDELQHAWAGGLNATQFNKMDLNDDGIEDLVLFDRMSNAVKTFIAAGTQYVFAPEYQVLFPELSNWLLLRDFNCDGRKDIFTGDVLGIKVFVNQGPEDVLIEWKQYLSTSSSGSKSQVLLTKGFTTKVNLQIQFDDLPAVADADGDGDLDIFNMRFGTSETIEYHKNLSMEKYGTCDSLDFERVTQTWGNIRECGCGNFAFDGALCDEGGGRTKHAGGKTLLALDANGDGKTDLLFSEAECSNLYLLPNETTADAGDVNATSVFPAVSPVNFERFPSAFFEDVDFDGVKDLLSSTNLYSKEDLTLDLRRSNWFYKNNGSNDQPDFTFVKDNFLQDEMIDVGDNAVPAFADHDGDDDLDLFISRHSSVNGASTIFLYENTGTTSSPEFTLSTEDYLDFSSRGFYNLKIHFTDIDHNGTKDLVFSGTLLTTNLTDVFFISNKSNSHLDLTGQPVTQVDFNLTASENLCFADLSKDGYPDILAGRSNGKIEYWKNDGGSSISFSLVDNNFLDAPLNTLSQNISCTTGDLDADGNQDLVYADQSGTLNIISNYIEESTRSTPQHEVIFNNVLNAYTDQNLGGRQWPVIANLYNTDKPAIVSGSIGGGISILKHDNGQSLPATISVDVFPNPVQKNSNLHIKTDRPVNLSIYNSVGSLVTHETLIPSSEILVTNLDFLSPGLYILRFQWGRSKVFKRVVVY